MRPYPFEYFRAQSIDHALDLLEQYGEEARLLAGGQSLVPLMNLRLARPEVLVDIDRLGLDEVRVEEGQITVGALARHAALLDNAEVAAAAPVIVEGVAQIGHPTIRRRGTAGGSVAHADPTAEWAALLLLLDGEVEARAKTGARRIAADDFFDSAFMTALAPGEMIAGLHFRLPQGAWGGAFVEFAEREGDFAIAAVAVSLTRTGDKLGAARVVLSGAQTRPVRARAAESLLRGEAVTGALVRAAAEAAARDLDCLDDLRASAAYRRHLFQVLTEDALGTAARRAGAAP
jgi:carbon-monoxide dehydrogenase medium subunit